MATGPRGIRVMVKPYPNPSPNSQGNSNRMQMRSAGWIYKKIFKKNYSSTAIILSWMNYLTIILFWLSLASLSFHRWSSGAFIASPARVPRLRWAHQNYWCSPAVEASVLGTVGPRANFARGKTALPQSGCQKPRKGRAGSSLSGWPQAPSGVPAVLFLFSRGRSPVLPQSTSGFPLPEKNPKTHGVPAGQDSVPQGGSQGRAWSIKNSGIELEVIDLGIITHVVLRKMTSRWRSCMLRPRTAHAPGKKKSKRENRTEPTSSTAKRLTDCANCASSWKYGEINSSSFFFVGSLLLEVFGE